ncbi:MAG: hypothetical protein HY506_01180 [Candidatus Yanofskybacteria bacterium]|nr:hypothetical protein [Candidatus Yanofskybacteria bacterium]
MADGYRPLRIKSVRVGKGGIDLSFEDSALGLLISSHKVSELLVGRTLWVKGRQGNEDVVLASFDPVEDMRLA